MFSVVIPLYNKAKYVERALLSVINQTFKEFEIIVVDDGSTDNSLQIIQQINKSTNQQINIIMQSNSGVSTARNNGVKVAKYDYIAFLDADDWWEPTFLEEMKALIMEFSEAGLYVSSYFRVKDGKKTSAQVGVSDCFEKGYFDYCKAYAASPWMPICMGAVVLRKNVFNEMNGFKLHLKLGEDFDLWIRIVLKYRVVFLNKSLFNYNQDVEVKHRGVVKDKIYEPATHFIFNLDYLQSEETENQTLKQLLDNLRVYTLLRYYIQNRYVKEFKNEIQKVDFSKQPKSIQRIYRTPRVFLLFKSRLLTIASNFKNILLHK